MIQDRVLAKVYDRANKELNEVFTDLDRDWVTEFHEKFVTTSGTILNDGWTLRRVGVEPLAWIEIDQAPYIASGFQLRWKVLHRTGTASWVQETKWHNNLTTGDLVQEIYRAQATKGGLFVL